jgi:dynein heavy chain
MPSPPHSRRPSGGAPLEEAGGADAVPKDIARIFKILDKDGNGKLDRGELASVLEKLDGEYWNIKRIRTLFRAADVDRDQFISWPEFLKWIFSSGDEQRALLNAVPALGAIQAAEEQTILEHKATLAAAETVPSLVAALEAASPLLRAGDLQEHEKRLETMRLPFDLCVSTLAGSTCTIEVTREQTVASLCQEVAKYLDKKAYRILLAHEGGRLEPPTATLEECGVRGSDVELAAQFGEVDALLELSLPEFFASVLKYKLASESQIGTLQQEWSNGKISEDVCRGKFMSKLVAAIAAEEKRFQCEEEARKQKALEEERRRRAEDEERKRKAEEDRARRSAKYTEHRSLFEDLSFEAVLAQAVGAALVSETTSLPESCKDTLIQKLSLTGACQACQADALTLKPILIDHETRAANLAGEANQIKCEAQVILDDCFPQLDAAFKALKGIRLNDLHEIRCFKCPPELLQKTLTALSKMFQLRPDLKSDPANPTKKMEDYWPVIMRELIGNPKRLLDDLFCYDKDNIPEKCILNITAYIEDEACTPEMLRRVSTFGEAICLWLRGMYTYHFTARAVEPLRLRLREKEMQYQQASELLSTVRMQYKQLTEDLLYFEEELEEVRKSCQ